MAVARIPERFFAEPELESDERGDRWRKARDAAWRIACNRGMVALCGNRGSGKTQIACDILREFCKAGQKAIYTTAIDMFIDLRTPIQTGKESEREVLERFCKPTMLVIDEIQERGQTFWEDRLLTYIIDRRYRDMRATIIIANLLPEQFRQHLGESAWDRLRGTGGLVICEWPSFRGQ